MKDMVKCLDSLRYQQTRLVIVVDGLDSCEQDKVLLVLDAVHMLFSDTSSPFIVILAIDPHVIAKVRIVKCMFWWKFPVGLVFSNLAFSVFSSR